MNVASALDELRGGQVALPRFYRSLTFTNDFSESDSAALPLRLEIDKLFELDDSFPKGSDSNASFEPLDFCFDFFGAHVGHMRMTMDSEVSVPYVSFDPQIAG